jgi:hypothetical protein
MIRWMADGGALLFVVGLAVFLSSVTGIARRPDGVFSDGLAVGAVSGLALIVVGMMMFLVAGLA